MTKEQFKTLLLDADNNGTLLTPKHSPGELSTTWTCYRSVLSTNLAFQLSGFIASGNYHIEEYENTNYPKNPDYWVMYPTDPNFSVPASGVLGCSPSAYTTLDCLVVVSGQDQGVHMYGENSNEISRKERQGTLTNKRKL